MDKDFWVATGYRALRTVCQTALAIIGTNTMGVTEVDWLGVLSGAALAGVVSVLTSVGFGLPEVSDGTKAAHMRPDDDA